MEMICGECATTTDQPDYSEAWATAAKLREQDYKDLLNAIPSVYSDDQPDVLTWAHNKREKIPVPTEEELAELVSKKWKKIKPSMEAQKIRAKITFDSGKYSNEDDVFMPEYIWDIVDIAIQTALNSTQSKPKAETASPNEPTVMETHPISGVAVSRQWLKQQFPDEAIYNQVVFIVSLLQINAEKALKAANPEAAQPDDCGLAKVIQAVLDENLCSTSFNNARISRMIESSIHPLLWPPEREFISLNPDERREAVEYALNNARGWTSGRSGIVDNVFTALLEWWGKR